MGRTKNIAHKPRQTDEDYSPTQEATRSKKRKSSVGETSTAPQQNPADVARVEDPRFKDVNAEHVYHKVLKNEFLMASMSFHWPSILATKYSELFNEWKNIGVYDFLGFRDDVYEDLVREFYANMSIMKYSRQEGIVLKTLVKGKKIVVTESRLCELFGLKEGGIRPLGSNEEKKKGENASDSDDEREEWDDYTSAAGDKFVREELTVRTVRGDERLDATDLSGPLRVLHYAINRNIYPKKDSNNHITELDKEILWHVAKGRQINFAFLVIKMMRKKMLALHKSLTSRVTKAYGMPYGPHITRLLRAQNVPLVREHFIPFPHNWKVTSTNFTNMKLVKTVNRGWLYAPHVRRDLDQLAEEDIVLPPPISRAHSSGRSSKHATDEGTSRDAEAYSNEVTDLRNKVGELTHEVGELKGEIGSMKSTLEKMSGLVHKIWEKMSCSSNTNAIKPNRRHSL